MTSLRSMTREQVVAFAADKVAPVFGCEYELLDQYPRRMRLPLEPYLFIDQITKLEGKLGVLSEGTVRTKYRVPTASVFAHDGVSSWALALEGCQADLVLASYVGMDHHHQGTRVYRLLDWKFEFVDQLPRVGQTIQYETRIRRFHSVGALSLFTFQSTGMVDDKPFLLIHEAVAGFFTADELCRPACGMATSLDGPEIHDFLRNTDEDVARESDIVAGGSDTLQRPLQMVDRILSINPTGGQFGQGEIIAERDLREDEWYFRSHFQDDCVYPGSLMAEGCRQVLEEFASVFLGSRGPIEPSFQPLLNSKQSISFRRQVVPGDRRLRYRVEIERIEDGESPIMWANAIVGCKGRIAARFQGLALRAVYRSSADTANESQRLQEFVSEGSY